MSTGTVADLFTFEPEAVISLDFETFYCTKSGYTLRKMTTEAYTRAPQFEGIGIGVKVNDAPSVWMEISDFVRWAKQVDWPKVATIAHHAHFDNLILSDRFDIHPGLMICTMSMARAMFGLQASVSLANVAERLGVGVKGDEVGKADGKHRADFTSEEWLRYGVYCCNDTDLAAACFEKMMALGFPEVELWSVDTTIRFFTEPQFITDEPLLAAYLVDEKQRKADLMRRIAGVGAEVADDVVSKMVKPILMSGPKFAKLLTDMGEVPEKKISARTGKETWAFAKDDPGMQSMLESPNDEIRLLAEARVGVKSTINESRTERFLKIGAGGRKFPIYLKYAGAHTFRWSGADKQNAQNLERTNKKDPKKGVLRKSLLAPKGERVVAGDSAQIEARITAWAAGHRSLLEVFADPSRDLYSEFASKVFGRRIDRKKNAEDFLPGFISKCMTLGLGFGMGWFKFAATLLKGMLGGPPVMFGETEASYLGVDVMKFARSETKVARVTGMPSRVTIEERIIHCAVAESLVYKYRNENEPITEFWKVMDAVLAAMVQPSEETFAPGECCQTVRHGIRLPNGMVLRYPGLKRSEDGFSYLGGKSGKEHVRAYGGSMTENLIQALARIVVAEQMLAVRAKWGYPVATCTHDEIVLVVPEAQADEALANLLAEMKVPPAWAPNLPLWAEGSHAENYGGCK